MRSVVRHMQSAPRDDGEMWFGTRYATINDEPRFEATVGRASTFDEASSDRLRARSDVTI